ncbi:hypothetical protein ATK17_0411 [Branchiibius hedensis]|uniref:Uncharacterized protein n=1 Tax=Branchiibius hedensis TaxID=672460 RepID=A0A2Y8ZLC5_9MICO|nr:hypothetical protein [Branchiibius hedensis]PWJ24323.1 hypothetical protein ATK17_0411 [Branchiibius hedensis]SSA33140.1 hypothetical protein SAMN04489750_0411 [Branchiibius hedensis]
MSDPGSTPTPEPLPAAPTYENSTSAVGEPPKSIRQAVALMYAGAVLSAINLLFAIFSKSRIHDSFVTANAKQAAEYAKDHTKAKPLSATALDHAISQAWVVSMVSGAITVALWIVLAQTNKKGNSAARIIATVLTVLNVLLTIASLLGSFNLLTFVASIVMVLIAVTVTYLLWRPESSDYYGAVKAAKA